MLELHGIDVGAAGSNAFEVNRFQRGETGDEVLGMQHLWACNFGERRCELAKVRLSSLQRLDLVPNGGFTTWISFLILEVLRDVIR